MLLAAYLGTTAFVWYDTLKSMHDNKKRLVKEGYKIEKKRGGTLGNVIVWTIFLGMLSIPVVNLLFPFSNRDKERSYDEYKNMMLEAGHIEELDERVFNPMEDEVKQKNYQKVTNDKSSDIKVQYRPVFSGEITDIEEEKGYTYKKTLR